MKSIIIVYEPTDDGIRIARLLRGARNMAAELDRDAGGGGSPRHAGGEVTWHARDESRQSVISRAGVALSLLPDEQ